MMCAECGEVLDAERGTCNSCRNTDAANTTEDSERPAPPTAARASAPAMTDNSNANTSTTQGSAGSTLIEFPGVNRNRPAWRKELSERFREIQQRRAREAALEDEQEFVRADAPSASRAETSTPAKNSDEARASAQLGLVPQLDEPEINPIVAAALRRIERARSQESAPHVTRGGAHRTHGAATATARVFDERPEPLVEDAPTTEVEVEQTRATPLVVVPPSRPAATAEAKAAEVETAKAPAVEEKAAPVKTEAVKSETARSEAKAATVKPETSPAVEAAPRVTERVTERVAEETSKAAAARTKVVAGQAREVEVQEDAQGASRQPRHISGVLDEFWLERNGVELLPKVSEPEVTYDDRAPRLKRLAAAVIDLFVVALICAPFAAAIELTIDRKSVV